MQDMHYVSILKITNINEFLITTKNSVASIGNVCCRYNTRNTVLSILTVGNRQI